MILAGGYAKISCATMALATGVAQDLRSKRVSNSIIILAFLVCVATALVTSEISVAALSVLTAILASLPLWSLKTLGGGDVKLLIAISPVMTWEMTLYVLALSFIWGALLGVFQAILKGQFNVLLQNIFSIFLKVKPNSESLTKIPYTVALLFGYLSTLTLGVAV